MTILNTFANQSGQIPLSQLDSNFATPITIGTTPIILGDIATTITGLTLAGANLGTPTGDLANCIFPTLNQNTTGIASNVTGVVAVGNGGTGATTSTGSGNTVLSTSPTLVTPALGTPSALVGTNITGTATGLSIGGNAGTVTNGAYTNVSNTFTAKQSFGLTSPVATYGNYIRTATAGDAAVTVSQDGTAAGATTMNISTNSTTGVLCNFTYGDSTGSPVSKGFINYSGGVVNYVTTSDYRLKENVVSISDSINRVKNLRPIRYTWIDSPTFPTVDGFLAHEVQSVVPEAVVGSKDAVDEKGDPKYQGIDQAKIVPLLTAALQEAIARIEALEARLV